MIPNVYRIARKHGATAEVALVVHRLIRSREAMASAELIRIITETVQANWSPNMVRNRLKGNHV